MGETDVTDRTVKTWLETTADRIINSILMTNERANRYVLTINNCK